MKFRVTARVARRGDGRILGRSCIRRRVLPAPCVLLSLAVLLHCSRSDPLQELLRMASQVSPPPFVGQLTRGAGAPVDGGPRPGRHAPGAMAHLRAAVWAVVKESRGLPAARSSLLLGIARLITSRSSEAIRELAAAAAHAPTDPDVQNALAVAYLTRGVRSSTPLDLVRALAAVDRALAASPACQEARYNRALILSLMGLPHQARAAWHSWQAAAPGATLSDEARAIQQQLAMPDRAESWRRARASLERGDHGTNQAEVDTLTAEYPYQARVWAETILLGRWAEDAAAGRDISASATLRLVGQVGAAVQAQRRDAMLSDTVRVIHAAKFGSAVARWLLSGHRDFSAAMSAYDRQDLSAAESRFVAAERSLVAASSPFAGWASFYATICLYYRDSERATRRFFALAKDFPADRYPVLNGRIQWLLATSLGAQGNDQEGLDHNLESLRLLEASSGEQEAAFVHMLLAEAYDPLGEVELGWHHRWLALRGTAASGDHRRIHGVLNEAAQSLLREGFALEAMTVLDELLANADAWPDHPVARAEGLIQRVNVGVALGEHDGAMADVRTARAALATVPPSSLKDWLAAWLDLYEGLARVDSAPRRAVELLSGAFRRQTESGYLWDRPRYLAERARAHLTLGETVAARADLKAAIDLYEQKRQGLAGSDIKMRYFRLAQSAFDTVTALDLAQPGGEATAFRVAEQARARFLLDRLEQLPGKRASPPLTSPSLDEVARRLPAATALVEYAVLPDAMVAWVVQGRSWHLVRLKAGRQAVALEVETLRRDLERGASAETIQATAGPLYRELIAPLGLTPDVSALVLVPDRFLLGIPFSALYNDATGLYLLQRFAVSVSPSCALALEGRRPAMSTDGSALVVAASRTRSDLPPLPSADQEARDIATLYPRAKLLIGATATRHAFLTAITGASIVHLATHASVNPEVPSRTRLHLSPAGDDGDLLAQDLWPIDLDHVDLVVLASCDSMAGQGEGREALYGVAGGLLAAGVLSVVASQWRVDDTATARLMTAFHRRYRQHPDAAAALRQAVLDETAGREGAAIPPGDWAAFAVLGGLHVAPGRTGTATAPAGDQIEEIE